MLGNRRILLPQQAHSVAYFVLPAKTILFRHVVKVVCDSLGVERQFGAVLDKLVAENGVLERAESVLSIEETFIEPSSGKYQALADRKVPGVNIGKLKTRWVLHSIEGELHASRVDVSDQRSDFYVGMPEENTL